MTQAHSLIPQLGIMVFGLSAIWLVNCRGRRWRRWGPIMGLLGQPFWVWTTIAHEQYGVTAMCAVYAAMWGRGIWNNWIKPEEKPGA
jgi:hypothetical protein